MSEEAWYSDGLRFACRQCGRCCTGGPGTVGLSDAEIADLAARFELTDAEFRAQFTRTLRGGDISLLEKDNYDCIFYDRTAGCTVYEERPLQCRSWPFWRSNVFSPEAWNDAAEGCPGMNSGRRYEQDEIRSLAAADGTSASRKRSSSPR